MAPKNRGKICMRNDATDMLIDLWSEETIEVGLENGKSQRRLEKYTTRYTFSSCQVQNGASNEEFKGVCNFHISLK